MFSPIGPEHAELDIIGRATSNGGGEVVFSLVQIVWMNPLSPVFVFAFKSPGWQSIQCFEFRRPDNMVLLNIPLKGSYTSNALSQCQAFLGKLGIDTCCLFTHEQAGTFLLYTHAFDTQG